MDSSFDSVQTNRAASRKFLSQLIQSSRGLSVPVDLQPTMLHRSPSGAKRKIRQQRGQEGVVRPSGPSSSPPSSSSSSTSSTQSMSTPPTDNYRSLIDNGGYQSILPDLDTSFSPPVPAPRLHVPFSSSMSHLERISSSSSSRIESSFSSTPSPTIDRIPSPIDYPSSINNSINNLPPTIPPLATTKPTVEVHPMPSEQRKKEKPAVPAKPKGLKLMDQSSSSIPSSHNPSPITPTPVLNRWNSTSSLYNPPMASSPLSTSSLFINQLFSTPSFANLTASFDKVEELDEHEKEDFENRRIESLCSLTTRIARLQEELMNLHKEMRVNDEIGHVILEQVESIDPTLYDKVRRQMENEKELVSLETKLKLQLEKCTKHIKEDLTNKKSEAVMEETRLRGKLNETRLLRSIYSNREREVERSLTSLLREEDNKRWITYKDGFCKMIEESRQIEMALNDAKMQLRFIHSTKPLLDSLS